MTHDLLAAFDSSAQVRLAVKEMVAASAGRKSIIVFCCNVAHCEHVASKISEATGDDVETITGETPSLLRTTTINRFKAGELRWMVNCDVLTTGFDAPNIDCVAVVRSTVSPGLFAQMCGRGFRLSPGKENFLLLDFGENIKRHGPIDSSFYGMKGAFDGWSSEGKAPEKQCPSCEQMVPAGLIECPCGWAFPDRFPKHAVEADTSPLLAEEAKPVKWLVTGGKLSRHRGKNGKKDTLRVSYQVSLIDPEEGEVDNGNLIEDVVSQWLCPEHKGYARTKFEEWWQAVSLAPVPDSITLAVDWDDKQAIAWPKGITTVKDGRFDRITEMVPPDKLPTEDQWGYEEQDMFDDEDMFDEDIPF